MSPVAAVTPPSPGGQPATVASATAASPTDRPTTPTGGWHGPACTQCCWAWSARRSWLGLGGTRHRLMTPVGWPSSSRFSATPPDPRGRCAIDDRRSRDRWEERGNSSRFALRGAQTGHCARRRATITTCPVGWDRRPTRSHTNLRDRENVDDFVDAKPSIACLAERDRGADRSRTRISAAHAAWWRWSATATPWRRGRRSLAAPHWPPNSCVHIGAVPFALGDGGRWMELSTIAAGAGQLAAPRNPGPGGAIVFSMKTWQATSSTASTRRTGWAVGRL